MFKISVPSLAVAMALTASVQAADLAAFWTHTQRGGNSFNRLPPDASYYEALRGYGASWVRLSYDKWKPEQRDFLMGNADDYRRLSALDLATLKASVAQADAAGLKVVIAPLSLPLSRWSQNNDGKFDDRIWQDKAHWKAAGQFWQDLARALKDTPGIAAYNLVNEPAPEKEGGLPEHAIPAEMQAWYAKAKGGSRDLLAFYNYLIAQVRAVDPDTPIMVDAGWYGAADAFAYWPKALEDKRVLYSFHMYEPYQATSGPNLKRKQPYRYPGEVPFAGKTQPWNKERVARYLDTVNGWARSLSIPPEQIVMGEFGCVRMLDSCSQYLDDVLSYAEDKRYHWAFYSFREDAWDAMDYELGQAKVHWRYWDAMEKGQPDPVKRSATPEFEPIRKRLQQR